ncbi:MAG: HNH endonuclease [Jannaschia helgolandensis]|jgi:5-methylcytosine-specific restriction endonuclease McrA|uniref:HNH endonuclease n=1 Tax=Jannaschia helgolandensis TaxID=188906 RepID=UPI003C778D91
MSALLQAASTATGPDFRTEFTRDPAGLKHFPALVLNADYRPLSYYPLSLWPWQDAVKAAFLDRVTIVSEYEEVVRSPSTTIRIPSVVVLKDYVAPQRRVAFTRFNLFLRDEFACQYCGSKGDLTFDHVVPRARGGITSWENVVAACGRCNLRKGSKSLKQVGFHLRKPPRRPEAGQLMNLGRKFPPNHLHASWMDYLYWDAELEA